ncbi:hypothetical protein B484DRAFT_416185 [Ochromonadaceae sp. CCMP2298]|nr:hypothetical protein B484DRAFT_416185 [Ochromonadaceae sp. CCMP2298]
MASVWEAVVVTLILFFMLLALFLEVAPAYLIMLASLVAVWDIGILNTEQALSGFSNPSMIMVGALFVVAAGVEKSHLIERITLKVFGDSDRTMGLLKMSAVTIVISAFFNNTPVVFMLIPIIRDWARSKGYAPSQFLMPMSFASIFGGVLTIIGTSTNLVVNGLLEYDGREPFSFFEPGYIGLPLACLALLYITFVPPYVLPADKGGLFRKIRDHTKEMVAELEVTDDSPYVSLPVEELMDSIGTSKDSLIKIRRRLESVSAEFLTKLSHTPSTSTDNLVEMGAMGAAKYQVPPPPTANTSPKVDAAGSLRVDKAYIRKKMHLWEGPDPLPPLPPILEDEENKHDLENKHDSYVIEVTRSHFSSSRQYVDVFPVPEREAIQKGDIVFLTMDSRDLLSRIGKKESLKGLKILDGNVYDLAGFGTDLVEVVLSDRNPFIGKSLQGSGFGKHYGAAVVAARNVKHNDEDSNVDSGVAGWNRLQGVEMARDQLCAGDLVMMVAPTEAYEKLVSDHGKDFFVVSCVGQIEKEVQWYDYGGTGVFLVMLILLIVLTLDGAQIVLTAMIVMVMGGWVSPSEALNSVDFHLLTLIGASLGFAKSVSTSGLAHYIASFVQQQELSPLGALFLVATITMVLTNIVTNNAAAALAIPIALSIADSLQVSYKPFAMAVLYSASVALMTPIGYQTNTMVWGPGGYTFADFFKFGAPLNILYISVACLLLPLVFPF